MSKYSSNKDVADMSAVDGKVVVDATVAAAPLPEKRESIFAAKGRKNFGRFI